ncbi:uncharacterized protein FA14DRAFT_188195 [Meira miltonrushii]|uniref:Zn(2)-C6 fungal-type domain-containing protein n=1 Tax=Meira miltonrushii TaxID=1280837 RepID=A0A316VKM0_9BASI|nr:uncharacterized protein FA14DRAFT_188195 [Meira miltonrushii]PWN38169.1 hypothetical protein FA14DRAFT_188195 [Meira miltonrushii]
MDDSQTQSFASNSDGEEAGPSSGNKGGGGQKMNKSVASPSNTSKSGIKRQRVHFSCTECSRRKQKCNRETPCQHCIARKIPERCKIFQPGEDPNDLTTRVSRLEQSVNDNFERMFSMVNTLVNSSGRVGIPKGKQAQAHSNGIASWRDQINSNAAKYDSAEKEAEGSEAGDEVVIFPKSDEIERPIPAGSSMDARFNSLISDSVDRQGALFRDPLLVTDPMAHIEGAAQLDAVMFELGATFSISQVLTSAMPPRELFDELIDHFFVHNNWLRQPLSRKRMMKTYERFWQNGGILHVNNINAYSTFMLAAAIGAITYRGRLKVSDDPRIIRLTTKRMFFAARQGLLISTMLGREDIQQVVAFHLAGRYLFLDRRVSEAWSCVANGVRSALSIGLHRDGSILGLPSEEIAARRRIWSIVYFGDRILCMNLGRPTAIDDNVVDTELVDDSDPTGEFDEYMKVLPGAKIPPGEKPRFLTFTRVRSRLAVVMGKVVRIYQNVQTPAHYSDVVAIDHELDALHKTFAGHLRSEFDAAGEVRNVNTDWDSVYEFVPVHRYLQQAELLFIRMSLHRSYLLRPSYRGSAGKGGAHQHHHHPHHRYNFSRRSCIEAAYQTLKLRADLTRTIYSRLREGENPPSWVGHLGTFNTTSAIVILGIYLLMEPDAENADMLLRPLRAFYELQLLKRKRMGGTYDETKEREFTILRLFVERIDEARAAKANRNRGLGGKRGNEGDSVEDHRPKKNSRLGPQSSLLPSDGEQAHFVESPTQRQSKEEDTATVLLDLNQGADARRNKALEQRKAKDQGKDEGLPWPYLPMRTPHHNNSNESPYGLASSNSSATNNHTPPMTTNGMNTSSSGSTDDANGASVLQMFESWFRYNAFENIDVDALGTGAQRLSNASSLPTAANESNPTSISPFVFDTNSDGPNTAAQGSWNGGASNTGPLPPPPLMNSAQSSSVPWSTVPMPSYSNNSNNDQSNQVQQPSASSKSKQDQSIMGSTNFTNPATSTSMSGTDISAQLAGIGIPPGMKNSFFDGSSLVDPNSDPAQNSINAASYDPAFWQSLMDKISG